jgi:hypothetical protein
MNQHYLDFDKIFMEIVINWKSIEKNAHFIRTYDIESNEMCKQLKLAYPLMDNKIIQAYSLTYTLLCLKLLNERICQNANLLKC